jgi:hypothetical protein
MTIAIILVVLALLALLFLLRIAKDAPPSAEIMKNPAAHIWSLDVEAFRNLIDPDEQEFLRSRLPRSDFRRIQRERLHAAVEYISCAAHDAAILLRLAEPARRSSDPATAEAAEKLVANANRLRLYALQTPSLYVAMVFPGARIWPVRIAERYEQMTRQVVLLGLKYPARGVSAAL